MGELLHPKGTGIQSAAGEYQGQVQTLNKRGTVPNQFKTVTRYIIDYSPVLTLPYSDWSPLIYWFFLKSKCAPCYI